MTKTLLSALALVLAASCNQDDPAPAGGERASQALQALSVRDEDRIARCNDTAEACPQDLPGAAGAEACAKLAEHCTQLQERLEEVRSPAVGCWRAVQECAAHTPEQAQCQRDVLACETTEEQVDAERAPLLDCSERVQACLVRVAELPDAAAVSCTNIGAACERAALKGADGPDAGKGSDDEQDEDEDDGGRGGGNQPRGPRDKDRGDAGVAAD